MRYLRIKLLLFSALMLLIISCDTPAVSFNRIEYNIPGHISINEDDLKSAFREINTDPASSFYMVVTLYSYSSGTETISFSGGDDVKTVSGKGRIKALLKIMDGNKIIRAEFAEGGGGSREEMIASLVKDFKIKMNK